MAEKVLYQEPFNKKLRGDEFGNMASYRKHPHRGQDWHPAEKTLIRSISDGKIVDIFWSDVLGNVVEVLAADGVYTQYAHLAAKPTSLKTGSVVKRGQPIGRVGGGRNTPSGSASTGAHLHMGMSKVKHGHLAPYEKLINPLKWITANLAPDFLDGSGDAPAVPAATPVLETVAEPVVAVAKPAVAKKPALKGELKKGSKGATVSYLQNKLSVQGDTPGTFEENTHKAVVALQKKNKLTADGVVGPLTWKALG